MRHAALSVLVAVLVLAGCGSSTIPMSNAPTTLVGTATTAQLTTAADPTTTTTTTPGPPNPKWVPTRHAGWELAFAFAAGSSNTSEEFVLSGAPGLLTCNVVAEESTGPFFFAVYVLPEGYDLNKLGGSPDVTMSEPGEVSTPLSKDAGSYFIHVEAANLDLYNVAIEEQKQPSS